MDFSRKLKRVAPLVKLRKSLMEQEAARLVLVRIEKTKAVNILRENQQKYLEGLNRLNQERNSASREVLATLERSLDHVRTAWERSFRLVQEVERQEELQANELLAAQKDLRSLEKLRDRYQLQQEFSERKSEQKFNDELALQKHRSQDSES